MPQLDYENTPGDVAAYVTDAIRRILLRDQCNAEVIADLTAILDTLTLLDYEYEYNTKQYE